MGVSIGACWVFYLLKTDSDGFIFLDYINVVFHEAGHPLFGIVGPTASLYGGTLTQLLLPMLVVVSFWRQRDAVGSGVAGMWLFENFLNIARYMADARSQVLPLVGGGEHDWTEIFTRWGVLEADTHIAQILSTVGWVGMLVTWTWVLSRWRSDAAVMPHDRG